MNSIDYFETAKQIVREDAAKRLAKIKPRKTWDVETVVYVTDADGQEWEIEVGICYDAIYEPAYTSGLPENCYPDSSEMDITDVISIHDLPAGITEAMVMDAAEVARARLEDECWEDYNDKKGEPA